MGMEQSIAVKLRTEVMLLLAAIEEILQYCLCGVWFVVFSLKRE